MDGILRQFAGRPYVSGTLRHKCLRQLTTAGFMLFFAKGLLWIAAAIWFAS
jgi:hypothetical protein